MQVDDVFWNMGGNQLPLPLTIGQIAVADANDIPFIL